MSLARSRFVLLPLLLAGCGGHGGGGSGSNGSGESATPVFGIVSTGIEYGGAGAMTTLYDGTVASSDFGALPALTKVFIGVDDSGGGFAASYYNPGSETMGVSFECTYTDVGQTGGTFVYSNGTGPYTALSGTKGYFTLTPTFGASGVDSTLRLSAKPIPGGSNAGAGVRTSIRVVSTDLHDEGEGTPGNTNYEGSVASSSFGSQPAPTHVEAGVETDAGQTYFYVACDGPDGDRIFYKGQYNAGSTTAGTFSFNGATGDYLNLSGSSGYFTLTPNAGDATHSTLTLSSKPIE